jgi:hypothetical protein
MKKMERNKKIKQKYEKKKKIAKQVEATMTCEIKKIAYS